jgi:hypothetical protein
MTEKRMPVAERQQEPSRESVLQLIAVDELAGYRAWCPDAKAG